MPVPRKFDRRPPERDLTRTNDRIRVPEVRLIGDDGKQIGVIKTADALAYAQERDLDLVEVAPDARPPVCRVLDYSKYKYEQAQKVKAARRHQQQITIREIKFRPKIAQNDYDTKKNHVARFLMHKDKVKITIMFRGREVTHPERGVALLEKLAGELSEIAIVEQSPLHDGRNMTMMLSPSKSVLAADKDKSEDDPDSAPVDSAPVAPAPAAESEPVASTWPELTPEPEPAPEPVASTDPEPEPATEPEPEPVAATEPEPVAATEPEPVAATEPEPDAPSPAPVVNGKTGKTGKTGKAGKTSPAAEKAKPAGKASAAAEGNGTPRTRKAAKPAAARAAK